MISVLDVSGFAGLVVRNRPGAPPRSLAEGVTSDNGNSRNGSWSIELDPRQAQGLDRSWSGLKSRIKLLTGGRYIEVIITKRTTTTTGNTKTPRRTRIKNSPLRRWLLWHQPRILPTITRNS